MLLIDDNADVAADGAVNVAASTVAFKPGSVLSHSGIVRPYDVFINYHRDNKEIQWKNEYKNLFCIKTWLTCI